MTDSDLSPSERVTVAPGDRLRDERPGPEGRRARARWSTAGAASVCSTPRDMARYVAALLGGGANEHGSVLRPATVASMFAPQYQPDPRIPGIGLAFFRVDLGGHPAVEHQGTLPGFHSQIFLAPDDGVGVMAFTNGSVASRLLAARRVLEPARGGCIGVPDDAIRTDIPQRPEVWPDLCGWYLLPGPLTDVRMRGMFGAGAEVFVRGGRLMVRFLTPIPALFRGFPLQPDDEADPTCSGSTCRRWAPLRARRLRPRARRRHDRRAPRHHAGVAAPARRRSEPAITHRLRAWCAGGGRNSDGHSRRVAGGPRGCRHERHDRHRPLAHERHGPGRGHQVQARVESRGHRVPPAADRPWRLTG